MDLSSATTSNGSIEGSKDQMDGEPAFRVPSVPTSPSSTSITVPVDTQSGLVPNHNSLLGNTNGYVGPWGPTTAHCEKQDDKSLCPTRLLCLASPDQQPKSPLGLNVEGRNGAITSTPITSEKKAASGGLIRPIPSRLRSPYSPLIPSALTKVPESHSLVANLAASSINPFTPKVLMKSDMTHASKLGDLMESQKVSGQKSSVKPECATKIVDIEEYDSAFEDESTAQSEEESCSRTTPNNHKSIRKWRQHSLPGGVRNISRNNTTNQQQISDLAKASDGFYRPSPFQPISIRTTSSTVINEATRANIPSPFDIDVHRLSPAGPLSAPSTFHWNNPGGSLSNHRPNSTGGSTSSSGCSSFLGGGPFSPNDSLFASPGSNASSNGVTGSISSASNSSSFLREHDSSSEIDPQSPYSFPGIRHHQNTLHHKSPVFRRTTTTVLTKTETVTSPDGSVAEEYGDIIQQPASVALSSTSNRTGINIATTSSGSIPVGIAVARQRTTTTSPNSAGRDIERNIAFNNDSAITSIRSIIENGTNTAQSLIKMASGEDPPTDRISKLNIPAVNAQPVCDNATNGDGILRHLRSAPPFYSPWSQFPYLSTPPDPPSVTNDNFALQSIAAAATLGATAGLPPLGGYQLAKDPLTGQVFFVPSAYNTQPQPHHMMWPSAALAAAVHQLSAAAVVAGPPSIPPPPPAYPAAIPPHQHHSFLQQWQRETELISAMNKNYQDLSTLSTFSSPLDVSLIKPDEPKDLSVSNKFPSQPSEIRLQDASQANEGNSKDRRSPCEPSRPVYNSVCEPNLNGTKDNNKCDSSKIVVKTDPCAEQVSARKYHKKLKISESCQSDENFAVSTKTELLHSRAKHEDDTTVSESKLVDIVSKRSPDDNRLSIESTSNDMVHKALKEGNDSKSWQYNKVKGVKVEKTFSSMKTETATAPNINQDVEHSVNYKAEDMSLDKAKHLITGAQSSATDCDGMKNVVQSKNDYSSQILTTASNTKSGLDILAEGVEQLEGKIGISDGSKHTGIGVPSSTLYNFAINAAPLSPFGLLCDAAVLKAEEDEYSTPLKKENNTELKSGAKFDQNKNLNSATGRSRSLDSHISRKVKRRNSLCVSSEFGRRYRSPKTEKDVKAFIASKSIKSFNCMESDYADDTKSNFANDNNVFTGGLNTKDMLSGLKIDTGKPSVKMDNWENDMRLNLANIQKKYREKYKELYRLEHQAKRIEAKQKKRPSIGKELSENSANLPYPKSPIVSPKKHFRVNNSGKNYIQPNSLPLPPSKSVPLPLHPDIIDAHQKMINTSKDFRTCETKDIIDGNDVSIRSDVKVATPFNSFHSKHADETKISQRDIKNIRSGRRIVPIQNFVSPPSTPTQESNVDGTSTQNATDLSAITSKFKVAKPNPFENLLRLSSKSSGNSRTTSIPSNLKDNIVSNCSHDTPDDYQLKIYSTASSENVTQSENGLVDEGIVLSSTKTTAKGVTNADNVVVNNTPLLHKGALKPHQRKRMVETYILKKSDTSQNIKQNPSILSASLPPSQVKHKDKRRFKTCGAKDKIGDVNDKNRGDNENVSGNFSNPPDINASVSVASQSKKNSNLKLKLKQTVNEELTYSKEEGAVAKGESAPLGSGANKDKNFGEKKRKNKKLKKNKSKKSKKEKRENKYDKSTMKKMKVKVGDRRENCMDSIDAKEQELHSTGTSPVSSKINPAYAFSKFPSSTGSSSCVIKESDLNEGVRVLAKLDGHFYPGKILAISPPDIYGILVDRERGNRPHIFSREEVLKEAIFEVQPGGLSDLPNGTRVCAYWSEKYHHLFPGTIAEDIYRSRSPKDKNYVNIELDDGDDREVHIKNIRFLPPDYPIVSCDNDPLATVSRRRRRQSFENFRGSEDTKCYTPRSSIEDVAMEERIAVAKRARYETEKTDSSPTKASPNKQFIDGKEASRRLKFTIKTTQQTASNLHNNKREPSSKTAAKPFQYPEPLSGVPDTAKKVKVLHESKSNAKLSGKNTSVRQNVIAKKGSVNADHQREQSMGMAAFLPAQQLWRWSTKGHKRARGRILHLEIERDEGEQLAVGDCAIFLSTGRSDRPYVGRLESLWETSAGHMRVRVQWFYHASETEGTATGGRRVQDLKMPGALFESSHFDENDIQTIAHRCEVLPFSQYEKKIHSDPSRLNTIYENNDLYYLAGQHDPIEGTIQFENGVLDG